MHLGVSHLIVVVVADIPFRKILGLNQQTYQRLKLALSLNLRRQIFIAVCDDLTLRDRMATQLIAELNAASEAQSTAESTVQRYPRLVSLTLNQADPNPIVQIAQWVQKNPPPKRGKRRVTVPAFQFLGIEQLTRQSPTVQRLFYAHLQGIERSLPALESGLLLWIPRPWFNSLAQSAPAFWRCQTGIFEFIGDPTPVSGLSVAPEPAATPATEAPPVSEPSEPAQLPAASQPSGDLWTLLEQEIEQSVKPHSEPDELPPPPVNQLVLAEENLAVEAVAPVQQPIDEPLPQVNEAEELQVNEPVVQEPAVEEPLIEEFNVEAITFEPPPIQEPPPVADLQIEETAVDESVVLQPVFPRLAARNGALKAFAAQAAVQTPVRPAALVKEPEEKEALPAVDQPPAAATAIAPHPVTPLNGTNGTATVPLLQQIEALHQQNAPPDALADAYRTLGNFYRDRIERGDTSSQSLQIAIQAYEQVLMWLSETSPLWTDVLNDLGNLYWMLSRNSVNPAEALGSIQQSIQAYQLALNKLDMSAQPYAYPMIQNNLGAAYADLARYESPVENLQRSIQSYQQTLRYRKPETDPQKYASTQNNLGTTYWNLAQHENPVLYLKQAIAAYSEALQHYDPERDSLSYAMIQNNLGTAYWNLSQHERPQDWLRLALSAYQTALKHRTLDATPAAYAATQNNLGTAYWHLAEQTKHDHQLRLDYLQRAVNAYKVTLVAADRLADQRQPVALNFDLNATHNNLGLAHYQIATNAVFNLDATQQANHLEVGLHHHLQALEGWQRKPDLRQTALNSIVQTIRALYNQCGMEGQNIALSRVPGHLLPEILPKL